MYYKWSKEFLEAGKQRLVGDTQREADSQEVGGMRSEIEQLKQPVAELSLKNRVLKKLAGQGNAVGRMIRCGQAEKQEIIHLVEHSQLPVRRRLDELNVPPSTFYRWYLEEGPDGLIDHRPNPRQFWNHILGIVRKQVVTWRWNNRIALHARLPGFSPIKKAILSLN